MQISSEVKINQMAVWWQQERITGRKLFLAAVTSVVAYFKSALRQLCYDFALYKLDHIELKVVYFPVNHLVCSFYKHILMNAESVSKCQDLGV